MIRLSKDEISFPDPEFFDSAEMPLAIGGDISPERLLFAYQIGLFPWYNPDEEILWWCPDPRFVLFPGEVKVSKSMKKILRNNEFSFTQNKCFREVMIACKNAQRPGQDGTWITDELIDSFDVLHQLGFAKSIETWKDGTLVGGFYGIQIGNVFCGESMFSNVSNASKAAFLHFVLENKQSLELIDCQIHSEHLESLGAKMISKKQFLQILNYEH